MEVIEAKPTFKKYSAYKDSGVAWLGEIPEGWEIVRLKYLIKSRAGYAFPSNKFTLPDTEGIPVVRITDLNIDGNVKLDKCPKLPNNFSSYIQFYGLNKNDILFAMTGGTIGKVAVYTNEEKSLLNQRVCSFTIEDQKLRSIIYYWMNSAYWKEFIELNASGGAQPNISDTDVLNLSICLPPKIEQTAIANFLDEKTSQIDRAVAQKQKLIALLKERKQIIIQNAVTKGLDPNVKMKDSGVEWIGQIPEHWEVRKLKYMVKITGGFAFDSSDFTDSGVQIIKIANTYQNRLALERQPTFVPSSYLDSHKQWVIEKGDVLMSLTGTMGKTDYGFAIKVDSDERFLLNQRVARLTPIKGIDSDFLVLLLQSDVYLKKLYSLPSGTKQANLSNEDVTGISVPIPPNLEMTEILSFVESQSAKIDQAIALQQTQIEKLKEYKATLIDSAVTGKIKVSMIQQNKAQ